MPSLLLLPLCFLSTILLYASYVIFKQFTYWKRRKMLYIKPVPILGNNYPIYFRKESFAMHSLSLYKRYPEARYYCFFDFRRPNIMIRDPELIRDVCVKNFDHFTDHDPFVTKEMDPIAGRNLFALKGEIWKNCRSTLSPSYTASRMKLLFELMLECSENFVEYFKENPDAAKYVEAREIFSRYTADVIATSAFGIKVNSIKYPENEFFTHGSGTNGIGKPSWIFKIILLTNFPKIMRLFGATFFPKHVDTFLKKVIQETIQLRTEKGISRPDMIQLLINALNKKTQNLDITEEDVLGQAFIFFTAGFETASTLMTFIAYELATHPDIQEKLREEIDARFENENLNYESLVDLKYLDMVISETLRIHPPAAFTNRSCVKEYVLPPPAEGYPECRVEKNTTLIIPIFSIHHDPKYYDDPEKFDPERFSEENKHKLQPYTYLPFGVGPRTCIGNRFALMETKILIVQLLRNFTVKFAVKPKMPITYSKQTFTVSPAEKICIKLEARKKSN